MLEKRQGVINEMWKGWNRPLFLTAMLHFLLTIIFLFFSFFDDRTVLGLNVWLKPLKFAFSIGIYSITLSWIVGFVESRTVSKRIALWTVVGLWVEMILIALQAARGTKSHFNNEDVFGIIVYGAMGIFIGLVTFMLVWLTIELAKHRPQQWSTLRFTSVQMGLWLTIVGTLIGGWMSSKTGHVVGGIDGGEGLPFINWSTTLGDYRVSHFMGLHALQVFLLLGLWFDRLRYGRVYIWISFLFYSFLLGLIFYLTMQAKSMFLWYSLSALVLLLT